jgi:hypothetical protein
MGDIYSLNLGLAMFHMMKTTYICHGPEHRKSWKVDLTIYSIVKNATDNDTVSDQSKSKMKTRGHIYSDHDAQVNFSSNEYQILKSIYTPAGAHENPKPIIWATPPVFTNTPLSESLTHSTPLSLQRR